MSRHAVTELCALGEWRADGAPDMNRAIEYKERVQATQAQPGDAWWVDVILRGAFNPRVSDAARLARRVLARVYHAHSPLAARVLAFAYVDGACYRRGDDGSEGPDALYRAVAFEFYERVHPHLYALWSTLPDLLRRGAMRALGAELLERAESLYDVARTAELSSSDEKAA